MDSPPPPSSSPHEDEIGYQETRGMLYTQYQPATPQECMLVDQLASSWWRTIRARQCETDMLHLQIETLKRKNPEKPASPVSDRQALASRFITEPEEDFRKFFRYEAAIEPFAAKRISNSKTRGRRLKTLSPSPRLNRWPFAWSRNRLQTRATRNKLASFCTLPQARHL
jgi:hypothetical protein